MEAIDPNDQTNRLATEVILEKSKALKERTKLTNEKLNQLKEQADQMNAEKQANQIED